MGFFEKLDSGFLDGLFQPIVDWSGVSGFALARFALLINLAAEFFRVMREPNAIELIFIGPLVIGGFYLLNQWEREDKQAANRVMNKLRLFVPWGIIRLLAVGMCIATWIPVMLICLLQGRIGLLALYTISDAGLIAAFYFSGCTSKRPPLKRVNNLVGASA